MSSQDIAVAARAACPECTAIVGIDAGGLIGEIVECPDCLSDLEICSLDPPALSVAPEVEEDWGE